MKTHRWKQEAPKLATDDIGRRIVPSDMWACEKCATRVQSPTYPTEIDMFLNKLPIECTE